MNGGLVLLNIGGLLLAYELYKVFIGLEKKNYVYGDEKHSIEHLAYLSVYIISMIIGDLNYYDILPVSYFQFSIGCSSVLLWYHIRKERIENK